LRGERRLGVGLGVGEALERAVEEKG
jgi:hypothetical protein